MSARLAGRHILVTGAASGIGAATVDRLRRDGARVFGVDRSGDSDLTIDVTERGANDRIVTEAAMEMGALDGVVACAGISRAEPLERHDDDFWDQTIAVNVTAVFRLCRAAVPLLRASGRGRIVTIGSVMASFGAAGLVAYAASKHAVLGMSRAMASELGADNITVNCVQPGAIDTPMTAPAFTAAPEYGAFWRQKAALGRLGTAADVADVIAFLVSDDARFVTGHGIFVDGGAMQQP